MENKKIVDMEIGSQTFSKDGNWQVIRRFKSHIVKLAKHLQELEGSTTIEKTSSKDGTE